MKSPHPYREYLSLDSRLSSQKRERERPKPFSACLVSSSQEQPPSPLPPAFASVPALSPSSLSPSPSPSPSPNPLPLPLPPLLPRDVICRVEDLSAQGGWCAFQLKGLENQPLNSPMAQGGEAPVWVRHGVVAVCDVSRVELGGCRQGDGGPDDRERRSFRVESWEPIVGTKIHASQKNQLHIPHYREKSNTLRPFLSLSLSLSLSFVLFSPPPPLTSPHTVNPDSP